MKERIELLCKMLGVELEEEFMLEGHDDIFKITNEGIMIRYGNSKKYYSNAMLVNAVLSYKVIKLPWKPKADEQYFFLNARMEKGYDCYEFNNDKIDNMIISRVEIYKTEEEAIAAVKEKGWVVE